MAIFVILLSLISQLKLDENGWGLYQNVAKTYLKVVTEPDFWFKGEGGGPLGSDHGK